MKVYPITDNIYHATIFVIPKYDDKSLVKYFLKTFGHDYKPDNTVDGMHYALTNGETGVVAHYLIFKEFTILFVLLCGKLAWFIPRIVRKRIVTISNA